MIRITKQSHKYYGVILSDDMDYEMEEIMYFISTGNPILLIESFEDLHDWNIDEVTMINRNEDDENNW